MKAIIIAGAGAVLVIAGWAIFRPELLFINTRVNEPLPTGNTSMASDAAHSDTILRRGNFQSVAHDTKGQASVHELAGGKRVLRFTEFETSNGPDLRVFLVAADVATDNETVTRAGHIELGQLKGNIGDQNYELPSSVDLGKYRAVTIWCNRFSVNFGSAALR